MNYECARCGADVGNGGLDASLVVNDLDPDHPGQVRTLRFCRDREEGGSKVKGCARKVLSSSNLKHYEENRVEAVSA